MHRRVRTELLARLPYDRMMISQNILIQLRLANTFTNSCKTRKDIFNTNLIQSNIDYPTTSGRWPMDRCSDKEMFRIRKNVNVVRELLSTLVMQPNHNIHKSPPRVRQTRTNHDLCRMLSKTKDKINCCLVLFEPTKKPKKKSNAYKLYHTPVQC